MKNVPGGMGAGVGVRAWTGISERESRNWAVVHRKQFCTVGIITPIERMHFTIVYDRITTKP